MKRCLAQVLLVVLACAFAPLRAADAPRELHGVSDAFAAPGIALAWAVARSGAADATVVIRIDADPQRYPFIAVIGIDPFTRAAKTVLAPTAASASLDVRIPRAHFADFPRTEVRLFASAASKDAARADALVYYLGVPDTTPEIVGDAAVAASLAERIARARAAPAK
jgi:hypothetical protein